MRKSIQSMLGVTLLEIMLVLAIAAMIIVMSVRYYQSANQNSQANTFIQQVGAISAAVENLVQGSGDYAGVSQGQLESLLPPNTLTSVPWGGTMSFSAESKGYTLTPDPAPSGTAAKGLCSLIKTKLTTDNHYTVDGDCTSFSYTANV